MPGDAIDVMVSTYGVEKYKADLVRIICGDDDPDRGIYREEVLEAPFNGEYRGRTQLIDSGSYGLITNANCLAHLDSFTIQIWVWPTTPEKGKQTLVQNFTFGQTIGFTMFLDQTGIPNISVSDSVGNNTRLNSGEHLICRRWYLISASYDSSTKTLTLHQSPLHSSLESPKTVTVSKVINFNVTMGTSLMFAAASASSGNEGIRSTNHFNGKLDRPRLIGRALSEKESVIAAWDISPHDRLSDVVAAWDFSCDIGTNVLSDTGPNALHGHLVNLPSRGCKGFNWTGRSQNWVTTPDEYGAVHFHDDDLYDACWTPDFQYVVPADCPSGVYAARLTADGDEFYVTFFVRPPRGTTKAKAAFLASTVTYMAYSNYHWMLHERYAEVTESFWTTLDKGEVFLQEHNELGLSTYDTHSDGSGVRYASRLRPVLNMAPKTPLWSFNADTHILGWLEHQSIDYDVITDEDLHLEGVSLLDAYDVVITGAHPEYYTTPMFEGLRTYLSRKGRLIYLGGNGFIWRCALSKCLPGVVELRRSEDGIRYRDEEPGEYYLEFTGEYGGLWRRLGMAPQALVGVGTIAVGFDASGFYRRTAASHDARASFIFEGINADEVIGDFGILGDGASGSEIDAADRELGTPIHTLIVASSEGHSENTYLVPDETGFHHSAMDGAQNPKIKADMTFFETPGGGAVFSVGSIAWAASLPHANYKNNVALLSENVLRRFLDQTPFVIPD